MHPLKRSRIIYCAAALSSLAMGFDAGGSTILWNTSAGGFWGTASNWSPAVVPGSNDNAQFSLNNNYAVNLTQNQNCATLTVGTGSTGSILLNASGHTLSANAIRFLSAAGTVSFSGGTPAPQSSARAVGIRKGF